MTVSFKGIRWAKRYGMSNKYVKRNWPIKGRLFIFLGWFKL